jgi:hypothetical protein
MIKITDIKVDQANPDESSQVTIKLKNQTEEARVQVFAQHFIPTNAQ